MTMGATRTMVSNEALDRMARIYRDGLARIDLAEQADRGAYKFFHGYLAGLRDMARGVFGEHAFDEACRRDTRSIFRMEEEARAAGVDKLLAFMPQ